MRVNSDRLQMSREREEYLQPLPHRITVLLLAHATLLQHEELADELVRVVDLYSEQGRIVLHDRCNSSVSRQQPFQFQEPV